MDIKKNNEVQLTEDFEIICSLMGLKHKHPFNQTLKVTLVDELNEMIFVIETDGSEHLYNKKWLKIIN